MQPHMRVVLVTTVALALAAPAGARAEVAFERADLPAVGAPSSLAVGDLDGKAGPDVVVARADANALNVRLNDGTGHYGDPIGSAACRSDQIELADVTSNGTDYVRDGKLDAVLFCSDSGTVARMAGDGAGGFGAPHTSMALNSPSHSGSDHFALGRLTDYDRPPLLMYRTQNGASQGVLCSLYDYGTDSQCLSPGYPTAGGPMVVADFRGDGIQELLTLGGSAGVVAWGITDFPTRQWSWVEVPFGKDGTSGNHLMSVGDLTADGHPDLVTAWSTSSEGWISDVAWTTQGLTHSVPRTIPSVAGIDKLVTGDFDGDGHVDVMAVTGYGHAVVHAGDGAGGLGPAQEVPLVGQGNPYYASVTDDVAADIDRNGTPDVVVLDQASSMVEILRNLATPPVSGGAPTPPSPAPAPAPIPGPAPIPPAPKPAPFDGVTGLPAIATASKASAITLGQAANPPTRSVAVTLAVTTAKAGAKRARRPTTIGRATITIPAGKTRPLTVTLNAKGRSLLRRTPKLRVTATLVATGLDGTRETRARALTIKRRAKQR